MIHRHTEYLHPILTQLVERIDTEIIRKHNIPVRLFETSRSKERQEKLLREYKTRDIMSRHLFNLDEHPPLYATAVDYVIYINNKYTWNIRDNTIEGWYRLFGNLVLDKCPELIWGGNSRKSQNFTHFELRESVIYENLNAYNCVIPGYN